MMSTSQNSSTSVDLSGLVQKPNTAKQGTTLADIAKRLSQASNSVLIRHAIELSQLEKGWKNVLGVDQDKPKSEFVTEAIATRIVKAFGDSPSREEIIASKMPYQTAYDIVAQIIVADNLAKENEADADYTTARASFDEVFSTTSAPAESEVSTDN